MPNIPIADISALVGKTSNLLPYFVHIQNILKNYGIQVSLVLGMGMTGASALAQNAPPSDALSPGAVATMKNFGTVPWTPPIESRKAGVQTPAIILPAVTAIPPVKTQVAPTPSTVETAPNLKEDSGNRGLINWLTMLMGVLLSISAAIHLSHFRARSKSTLDRDYKRKIDILNKIISDYKNNIETLKQEINQDKIDIDTLKKTISGNESEIFILKQILETYIEKSKEQLKASFIQQNIASVLDSWNQLTADMENIRRTQHLEIGDIVVFNIADIVNLLTEAEIIITQLSPHIVGESASYFVTPLADIQRIPILQKEGRYKEALETVYSALYVLKYLQALFANSGFAQETGSSEQWSDYINIHPEWIENGQPIDIWSLLDIEARNTIPSEGEFRDIMRKSKMKYHPDRNIGKSDIEMSQAEQSFKNLEIAGIILKDQDLLNTYIDIFEKYKQFYP